MCWKYKYQNPISPSKVKEEVIAMGFMTIQKKNAPF
jgi:hypothetical protein